MAYQSQMAGQSDLSIRSHGLFVDQTAPYLGASPDALVHCTCCGNGVVEVKCPWSARDCVSLEEAAEQQRDFNWMPTFADGLAIFPAVPIAVAHYKACLLWFGCLAQTRPAHWMHFTCRPTTELGQGKTILQAMYTSRACQQVVHKEPCSTAK